MRAAIVGAGGAGLLHALSFRAHGVAVAEVFDPDPLRARNLADLCGARACDSLDALADTDADCISIASPPRWHVQQADRCARNGRTVFVEKPVALAEDELERLVRLPGCVPIVQWRAGRAIRAIRHAISEELLGPSPTVCVDLAFHRGEEYFAAGRGTREAWGCGALLSVGIHALDAVCFAMGRGVVEVRGFLGPTSRGEVEKTGSMLLAFARGAHAVMRVTFEGGDPDSTRLSFSGGGVTACIEGTEVDPTVAGVQWRTDDAAKRVRLETMEQATRGHTSAPLLVPYLGEAIQALREGRTPGTCEALPAIGDVAAAHLAAIQVCAQATPARKQS
jgi:predicted dehydrogenase